MPPLPDEPARHDRYRAEQFGCAVVLAAVLGVLLFFLAAWVFWGGPMYWLDLIREERQRP